MAEDDGYKEAQRRIEEAKQSNKMVLDLNGLGLTTLPPEIASLTALQTLYLSNNQLTTLPPEIASLTTLQELSLFQNQLTTLPPEIASLTALQELSLQNNQLTTLPPEIGALTTLQELSLHHNQLATLPPEFASLTALQTLDLDANQFITLPPEIASLTTLQTLDLQNNQLTTLPPEIGALTTLQELYLQNNQLTTLPPEIASLTALQTLDLQNNQLTTLPPEIGALTTLQTLDLDANQLTTLPPEIGLLTGLELLFLHNNPALEIPDTILGPTWDQVFRSNKEEEETARPRDILSFYFDRQGAAIAGTLRPVNEVKVMLVGRGGAGKTSLRRYFLGQDHDPNEEETPGIALDDFQLQCGGREIKVRLWDFAGQEITHALHQFFLTEGCVYLLVLDPRSNTEMTDAFYWLDQLRRYAADSPVLVALNRQDSRQGGYDVDRDLLCERYPQIRGFVKTNCAIRFGCNELRAALISTIGALDNSEPPGLEVPENWLEVKEDCWSVAREPVGKNAKKGLPSQIDKIISAGSETPRPRHTLTFEEFARICEHHGLHEEQKQESLARLLHKLGAVLHFVDDPRLRDTSVLNPHWVTDGVYRLLRYKDKPGSDGILTVEEATEALEDNSEDSARFLLGLMERFEMCFSLDEDVPISTRWLVPGSLDPYQPEGLGKQWHGPGATRMRYDYRVPVAEGILPRFIVLTHPLKGEAVWRNGVVLRDGDAAALVRRGESTNHIEVAAFGSEAIRLRLLELIQGTMERVNTDLPGRPPIIEQEIDGLPGKYKAISELAAAETARTQVVVADDPPPPVLVDPTPQLDRTSELASRDGSRVPVKTFLSYARADRSAKNIFATNLAVMKHKRFITPWHDGMIEIGAKWKEQIESQLESMDLFIGLLTTNFLASNFIREVELKAARERLLERENGRNFLFVLILVDDISLDGLDLAQYQLLVPGNKPVCKHQSRRDGFNQAQKEIEQLIKKHKPRPDDWDRGTRGRAGPKPRMPSSGSGGMTVIVQGDYIESGDKHMRDDHRISIGGDVINSQVGQTLSNCTNTINQQAPGERKELLEELRGQVEEIISRLPEEKRDKAPQIAEDFEAIVKEATKAEPRQKWYSVSAEGLLEASKWVKDFTGNIAGTIGQLGKLFWPDYAPPKGG